MTRADDVRSRRYALARALADTVDAEGRRTRPADALEELDRTLAEEGADPPDERIHLAAGRLLEDSDPGRALDRYLKALSGDAADESAERARRLLESPAGREKLISSVPPTTRQRVVHEAESATFTKPGFVTSLIERLTSRTRGRQPGQITLLASTLLRQSGAEEQALELLQRAYRESGSRARDVIVELADTLLGLGRIDDALALIHAEDPGGTRPQLEIVHALALLLRSDLLEAARLSERLLGADPAPPVAVAVRSLALLGLGRDDEARAALAGAGSADAPAVHLARAVICLQGRKYGAAGKASWALLNAAPNDLDALLLNAQTVVEALGAEKEDGAPADGPSDGAAAPGGDDIDAARRLLTELGAAVPGPEPSSRWWRAQVVARGGDGRFRYFRCELHASTGSGVDIDELDAVDLSEVTSLQAAAMAELRSRVLDGREDRGLAAGANDEAGRIFAGPLVDDPVRATMHARKAYERMPTTERAETYARRTLTSSYNPADPPDQRRESERAAEAVLRSLPDVDDHKLADLVNLLAWVHVRIFELDETRTPTRLSPVLPWLLTGVIAGPDDGALRAALAQQLIGVEQRAASWVFAQEALEIEPDLQYAIEAAVVAAANFDGRLETVAPLLTRHADLSEDAGWRNAVELDLYLGAGDRAELENRYEGEITDASWARRERALARAVIRGIPAARAELAAALAEATEYPPAHVDAVFLAALLGRHDDMQTHLENARDDVDTTEQGRQSAALMAEFARTRAMTPEDLFARSIEWCMCPGDLRWLENVTVPLLVAARSNAEGPPPEVVVDQHLLDARLNAVKDPQLRYIQEVGEYEPRLAPLVRLADRAATLRDVIDALGEARGSWPGELPEPVVDRIGRVVIGRAADRLPRRLLDAHLGRGPEVGEDEVRRALDGRAGASASSLLATALFAHTVSNGRAQLPEATEDQIAVAAGEVAQIATVEDYWTLEHLVDSVQADPTCPPMLRHTATAAHAQLGVALDGLLGLARSDPALEIPIVTPIVVEVGDGLLPIVDPSRDEGVFIEQLIPRMRQRIMDATGVNVPGVRMRGNPALGADEYRAQVDEVPIAVDSVALNSTWTVSGLDDGRDPPPELLDYHPTTGMPGVWMLSGPRDGTPGGEDVLTSADYLISRIETVIRNHLPRYLGVQEVSLLVDAWATGTDGDLVSSLLPDAEARVRLTWVLQALVREGVPITDSRTILTAVRQAGGIAASSQALRRAARAGLRSQLSGSRAGRKLVPVPEDHQRALVGLARNDPRESRSADPRHEFSRWLRVRIAEEGQALVLVTRDQEVRELVSALARTESRLITTMAEDELVPA